MPPWRPSSPGWRRLGAVPELPEVEVLRRSLRVLVRGDAVERVEVYRSELREPVCAASLRRRLAGRRILDVARRAKYLLIELEGGSTLAVHLGMSGRLTLAPATAPREKHEHAAFHLASGRKLRYRDPRRFGLLLALETGKLGQDRHFSHLGAEPLAPAFDGATLARQARRRRGPVKTFLMDATRVTGVGNIYACEALFRAGVHPRRSVARISARRWDRLAASLVAVLEEAVAEGGTTLNDFAGALGEAGLFSVSLAVYAREGAPCLRCGSFIRRIRQAGRSTFYCPRCQH